MREALRSTPSSKLQRPVGLMDLRVSRSTGMLADPLDPDTVAEKFMLQNLPPQP